MTKLPNRILIAIDGSDAVQSVINLAIRIAKAQALEIQGLYVVDEELILEDFSNYQIELGNTEQAMSRTDRAARFEERGHSVLQRLETRCLASGVPITVEMELGGVPELILKQAAHAQMLVLGRRGHSHANDLKHLGHNFLAIAHRVHLPMLVGGNEQPQPQRLLLAYNGQAHSQDALAWAARLQHSLSAEVMVVAIKEEDEDDLHQNWLEQIKMSLDQSDLTDYQLLVQRGQPTEGIVATVSEKEADLIVMGGYRHKALLEWLIGSTLDAVLRLTSVPVFIA